ncbi:MAG: SpoIIE family protein phosphatase [bacterium]
MVGRLGLAFRYLVLVTLTGLLAGFLAASIWLVGLTPHFHETAFSIGLGTKEVSSLGEFSAQGNMRRQGGTAVQWIGWLTPAENAGISVGDTIIAVNGIPLRTRPEAFWRAYLRATPGTEIRFEVKRDGSTWTESLAVRDPEEVRRERGWLDITWFGQEKAKELGVEPGRGVLIEKVAEGLAADSAGLRPHDIVLEANGSEIPDPGSFRRLIAATPPGQMLKLKVSRGHDTLDVAPTVTKEPSPTVTYRHGGSWVSSGSPAKATWTFYGPFLAMSLLCLAVGAILGWARPRDPVAFQCGVLFLAIGFQPLGAAPFQASWPTWALALFGAVLEISTGLGLLLTLRVFAVFPNRSRLGSLLLRLQVPYLAFLVLWGSYQILDTLSQVSGLSLYSAVPKQMTAFFGALDEVDAAILIYAATLASLVIAQGIEARRGARPQLRILELSLGFGVIALFLFGAGGAIFRIAPASWQVSRGFVTYYLPIVLFCAVPIGFAYTVLARKVFGIRFIIRRGIQHLLLSRGVLAAEGLLLFVIVEEALRRSPSAIGTSVPAVAGLAGAASVFAITGLAKVNRPFMRRIDRRFFRENYDARTVLLGMSQKMSAFRVSSEILEQAGQAILATLHPWHLAFLLGGPDAGGMTAAWSGTSSRDRTHRGLGHEPQGSTAPGPAAGNSERLQESIGALRDGGPWLDVPPEEEGVRAEESEATGAIELLVAIPSSKGMIGCIALAGKLSEEPFSREDKELLTTVATQMGLALENARLLEVAKREAEQAKELGIARQVQQNLFPRDLPKPPGWDLAATCRPAREVGGDYYDVFQIDEDHVALALGDVSGKGIGPALVMSNVQAMIRAELRRPGANLGEVLSVVNQHLHSSTSAEMFITLFLAVLNTRTGELRYANGGHNPPFVVGPGTQAPIKLTDAGPIVGIIPGMVYSDSRLALEPGSALVIYSDGVTEAASGSGDMFGEERLVTELLHSGSQGAGGTMQQVLAAVDQFAAGAEQADDISLIVIGRVSPSDIAVPEEGQ